MKIYRLAIATAFAVSASVAMAATNQPDSDTGFTFNHDAAASLPVSAAVAHEGANTRQEVVAELERTRRDGELQRSDSTIFFGH
ncbi:hypothetical protein PQQ51_33880 [Paraburkholderia xenovorans]|uniref:hypothetical protein n=1 Tax=Paraburkholderia xenovorans TaxID=36873 RepID=UPI0038B75344